MAPRLLISDEAYAQALAQMNQRYGVSHGKEVLDRTLWTAFESAIRTPAVKAITPKLADIQGMEDFKARMMKRHEEMGRQFVEIHRLGIIKLINSSNELDAELAGKLADEVIACSKA